ncbi:hypothetical protein FRC11_013453 [Ceratobasidium sp. 423]|nr:hypothetical protein FRC11_013453 [Ceratobasidium sp. 423]
MPLDGQAGASYSIPQLQAANTHSGPQPEAYSHYASGQPAVSALPQRLSKYSKALKSMASKPTSLQSERAERPKQLRKRARKEIEGHSTEDIHGPEIELERATVLNKKGGASQVGPSVLINEATKKLATPRPPTGPSLHDGTNARPLAALELQPNTPLELRPTDAELKTRSIQGNPTVLTHAALVTSVGPAQVISSPSRPSSLFSAHSVNSPQNPAPSLPHNASGLHLAQPSNVTTGSPKVITPILIATVLDVNPPPAGNLPAIPVTHQTGSPDPNDHEMANADEREDGDDHDDDHQDLISSIYEDNEDARWSKLYDMMRRMAIVQNNLVQNVQRINERVQNQTASTSKTQAEIKGKATSHISPPEPTLPIEWDQTVECLLPAGRQPHDKRLGLIREYISTLLGRTSVKDPLPHPPPRSQPCSLDKLGLRLDESEQSPYNLLVAKLIAQYIINHEPGLLSNEEIKSLPSLVSGHIKYLCRRYKNENRVDAEQFNRRRLKRCSADSQKRTLGVDGTSSDEEDYTNPGVYKIINKRELSDEVTQLKQ